MKRTYFTPEEAHEKTGHRVEALADFPSVPKGSKGTVVKARPYTDDKWVVLVEWHLPGRTSFMDAMIGDVSLNLFTKSKVMTDEFCKSEYETLLNTTSSG